jgi:hypothetical protein
MLVWLGRNKNGERTFVKMVGYQPQEFGSYAAQNTVRGFSTVDDCIAMPFQLNGHEMVWFTFPTAGRTLCYDATEKDWYNVGWWNSTLGVYERHRANTIVSAFGKILVGDHTNGTLYEMSPDIYDDDGTPLRWLRETPHTTKNGKNIEYGRLELFGETGNGLEVQAGTAGYDPQVNMQYSNDGGNAWSSTFSRSMGKRGERKTKMAWNRLGESTDRVYRFFGDSPTKVVFTGAALDVELTK